MIRARAHISSLAAYALADLSVTGGAEPVSLAQNESADRPSPNAISAASRAARRGELYPDPDWQDLRRAIAEVHGVEAQSILCGAGSMELIGALIRAYAGPGDEVLSTSLAYAFFRTATALSDAAYVAAAEEEMTVSVDAVLAAVSPRTRVVCVANPGNPTGTRVPRAELVRLREGLPPDVLLVIDEAYGEFADHLDEPVFDLCQRGDTVVLRTFSKAYSLAGMRVGWGVFPAAIAREVRKILNPNNVSAASQAAAAAAMRDQAHMRETVSVTVARRDGFARHLARIGVEAGPSATNFLLLRFSDAAEAKSADDALRGGGILMRGMGGYGLPECLRATIGSAEAMETAGSLLTDWTRKERSR
ncbi:aminotransferase class I/II-fold pyridoxal phosphate-dependent enzyme [Rhodobacteraceae bacterium NNCM2]|nr:aminotransferase class I/II-fold pyridoxal phosphate-dependent enzyme [Coraliihabitans acroporae]